MAFRRVDGGILMESKLDFQAKISKLHDIIKTHPYRMNFDTKWKSDYIRCLFDLSRAWSSYIWYGDHGTEEETRLIRQFGRWIHNYNQELLMCNRRDTSFRRFSYYEQMLQVTHLFIDAGELPVYYEIDYLWDEKHFRHNEIEMYKLVTKEMCGIDSTILPCYLPMKFSMRVDREAIREYIMTDFHYNRLTNDEKEVIYKNWLDNVEPVLVWLNENKETDLKHAVWESAQLAG